MENTNSFNIDMAQIERIASTYPAEIQDSFRWLGGYLIRDCNRSLDILSGRIKKLKFSTDKTTLSKVLQGRLQTDADGNPTPSPIISLRNFNHIIDTLREESRRAALRGAIPFIETPTWTVIKEYINTKWAPYQVCKFGLIIGATGTQKSACCRHFAQVYNSGRVQYLEAPARNNMNIFLTGLADCFGIPRGTRLEKKLLRLDDCVTERSCIIIDNIQRLYKPGDGWNQELFNYLQKLQDDKGCTIIMICVPEFELTLRGGIDRGYFEQFEGRVGGKEEFLVLPEYPPLEDILCIAQAFKLADPEEHAGELEEIARRRGRIRILFNALQKAKALVGNKTLRFAHVADALTSKKSTPAS